MISAELGLKLVVPEHGMVPLVASLYYAPEDPYAIRFAFHVGTDEPVKWLFARDLLFTACEFWSSRRTKQATGEGDVRLWVGDELEGIYLHLTSPYGEAIFLMPGDALTECAARIRREVPPGLECEFYDLDVEIRLVS